MTMLARMSEEIDDEDIKKESIRCFSNAPTTIQVIQVLKAMQQRTGEIARLYTARYEIIHYSVQISWQQRNRPMERWNDVLHWGLYMNP